VLLRLLVSFLLLFINLYACKGGYSSCVAKVKDSHTFTKNLLAIPVTKTKRLVYAYKPPHAKILKHDPFLSLYLIEESFSFAYPFELNMRLQLGTAVVTQNGSCEGKFLSQQIGLNTFANYGAKMTTPAIIMSSCCWLEGIVTKRGVIQKNYLRHFLKSKNSFYGDIGIRVEQNAKSVSVLAIDPFIKSNPFKKGDIILRFDGKRVRNAAWLMEHILFSTLGSKHHVKIKRAGKILIFNVITQKRYGGGFVSDTFLESRGLYFDQQLRLTKVSGFFKNYGLKNRDRLIQVNGVGVKNQKELRENIENFKNYSSLLFERDGFEFFVNIK